MGDKPAKTPQPTPALFLSRLLKHVRNRITAGLLVVIPAIVTYLVLRFLLGFLDGLLKPAAKLFTSSEATWVSWVSIGLTPVLLYLLGLVVATVLGRWLVKQTDTVAQRIPILGGVYRATKQATVTFSGIAGQKFGKVVLLEFPRNGVMSIGLLTGRYPGLGGEEYLAVYIPTVPNPTSGFLVLVRPDQVQETDLTVEEAFKVILSGGVLTEEILRVRSKLRL